MVVAPVTAAIADDTQPPSSHLSGTAAFFSDPGSYIGQGVESAWTPVNAGVSGFPNRLEVNATPPQGDSWAIDFGAPSGQSLEPGVYDEAIDDQGSDQPLIVAYDRTAGSSCDGTGRFEIKDIAYDASGAVTRFWALFELHCSDGAPALFGEFRLGEPSDDATLESVPSLVRWPADNFGTTATPLPVLFVASEPLSISRVSIAGAEPQDFRIARDACSGLQLSAGGSCSVQVQFDPLAAGLRTAELQVTDASGAVHSVPLQGFTYGGTTRLTVNSDPDSLGDGKSYTYGAAGDTLWAGGSPQEFQFTAGEDEPDWQGTFQPPTGQTLTAGSSWTDVTRNPSATQAGMDIDAFDYGCNAVTGQFQVLSATYDSFGDMTSFAVKFVEQCTDQTGAIRGEFDWRANDDVAPAPWMAADATGAPAAGSGSGGQTPPADPVAPVTAPAPVAPPTSSTSTAVAQPAGHVTDADPDTAHLKALVTTLSRTSRRTSQVTHLTRRQINRGSLRRARRSIAALQSELTVVRRAVTALPSSRRVQATRILKRLAAWQTTLTAERKLLSSPRAGTIADPLLSLVSRANGEASSAIRALGKLVA